MVIKFEFISMKVVGNLSTVLVGLGVFMTGEETDNFFFFLIMGSFQKV